MDAAEMQAEDELVGELLSLSRAIQADITACVSPTHWQLRREQIAAQRARVRLIRERHLGIPRSGRQPIALEPWKVGRPDLPETTRSVCWPPNSPTLNGVSHCLLSSRHAPHQKRCEPARSRRSDAQEAAGDGMVPRRLDFDNPRFLGGNAQTAPQPTPQYGQIVSCVVCSSGFQASR
jgi:hypothetical protein